MTDEHVDTSSDNIMLATKNLESTTKNEKWTESKSLSVGSYLSDPYQAVTPAKCITERSKTRSSLTEQCPDKAVQLTCKKWWFSAQINTYTNWRSKTNGCSID